MPTDRVLCANPMHGARKARARLSFPDAQFTEIIACHTCTAQRVDDALALGHSVLIEPIKAEDGEASHCPGGCGCRLGTDDADRFECGCDAGCCEAERVP